ncbi:MAG: DNA-directed RNA polymerase subunit alpha C-terminal domain-containing protein, partial [Deltaproteobacteria bacterium]
AEKAQTLPELHKVKQMLAAGWGGSGQILMNDIICCSPAPPRDFSLFLQFAKDLNQYDTKSDPDLSSIQTIIDLKIVLNSHIFSINCSKDDVLTVFLHLFLQSDYGKHLNRNISRIIKKRFKQAKLSKDLVEQISEGILPILSRNLHMPRSVEELELSVRTANCLKNADIFQIYQLISRTEDEMLKIKNFDRKSLNEIKAVLGEMKLSLGMKLEVCDALDESDLDN